MRALLVLALIAAAAPRAETTSEMCLRVGLLPADEGVQIPSNLRGRIEKACATILTRDHADELCIELAVRIGKTELGGVTLVDSALGWTLDVWNWDGPQPTLWVLGQIGDARAATKIIAVWKASLDKTKKWEKRSSAMQAWAGWRKEAAEVIAKTGATSDDADFLRDQAAATKDRYVKRACLEAEMAVRVRVLKQP